MTVLAVLQLPLLLLLLPLLRLPATAEAKGGTTCVACGLIAGLLFEKKGGGELAVADVLG